MRIRIIIVFLILLILQAVQIVTVSYSIRQLQSAVSQVTVTVEGREVSRSTVNLLDQLRDNVVLTAGMNFPVTGLKRLRASWEAFSQRLEEMSVLAQKLSFNPKLLTQLKENIDHCVEKKSNFEQITLDESPDATYTVRVHDAAFELDEAIENTKNTLDIFLVRFIQAEKAAVTHEQRTHNLPIKAVSTIGLVIGCILFAVGLFSVTHIVNPLIDLTVKYKIAMQKLKDEQEMTLALEKAQASAQAKSDFLANMSHELRTPMNAVLGFSQLLNDTELKDKQKNYLELIMSSGHHLVQIINDILDFSKLEAGKVNLEYLDFNLEEMINEVMKIASTRMAENPLDTYVDYPKEIPRYIKSDPTKLKQILVNLLINAIKFTPKGEVGILVRLDEHIDHQDNEIPLRISVKDSGIGIQKDKIAKIFDSFTQVDESTTRKYGGTGLGLTITKSIIEAMGGSIRVKSEEGKGSEFIFTLKVNKGKPVDHWEIDPLAKESLEGKKVFIVDDNQISRKMIKKTCESVEMEVLDMADSGQAALAKLDNFAQKNIVPDVILCDIMMPEMRGDEVAQKIRANKKFDRVTIVAVTKMSDADISHYIRDDCFTAYLKKPVSRVEMINVLAKELGYTKAGEKRKKIDVEDVDQFKGIRILAAENNITNLILLKELLETLHCDADYAYNGKEALAKLKSKEYDLCLMDLHMPVMGGIEAAKNIRDKISKTLPIIALTASVQDEDRAKAKEAGMVDFLEKPIDITQLKEKILQYGNPKRTKMEDTNGDKKKIQTLVVDDDLLNTKLLVAFLKKLDCESDTAVNGEEAVAKIKDKQYDICFMDIQMPIMGGVEATKIIREEITKDLPIIAVTAIAEFTQDKSIEAGMNDCLSKPVSIELLKKTVAKYTHKTA